MRTAQRISPASVRAFETPNLHIIGMSGSGKTYHVRHSSPERRPHPRKSHVRTLSISRPQFTLAAWPKPRRQIFCPTSNQRPAPTRKPGSNPATSSFAGTIPSTSMDYVTHVFQRVFGWLQFSRRAPHAPGPQSRQKRARPRDFSPSKRRSTTSTSSSNTACNATLGAANRCVLRNNMAVLSEAFWGFGEAFRRRRTPAAACA